MAMTQEEATAALVQTNEVLVKVGKETDSLLEKIEELEAALEAQESVSPELEAAVKAVSAQAKTIDELVPDVPPPTP